MADIAGIAVSGLVANKAALNTVSHNIANAGTAGYSRQTTEQQARVPQLFGSAYLGQGVDATAVTRISNQFVTDQLRRDTQNFNSYDAYYKYANNVDSLLGDSSTAIAPSLQSFFNSIQDLSTDPSSVAARQVVLSQGQSLVNRFNSVYQQLDQQNTAVNTELANTTSQITELAKSIANLNTSIRSNSSNSTGDMPNDLLDQRDEDIRKLSELVGVQVVRQNDLSCDVYLGNGQPLVIGSNSFSMSTQANNSGVNSSNVILTSGNTKLDVTSQISGGKLGGLLQVRKELIDPVFNQLGRVSMALSDTFNKQHELGMDMNNKLGGAFFGDINSPSAQSSRVSSSLSNTGTATMTISIDDTSALTADNYNLSYDSTSGNYTLTDTTTNAAVATFANPGPGNSVAVPSEGFTINFTGGAPQGGDQFLVMPTRFGANQMNMQISSVDQIAAAMPVTTNLPTSNTGSGYVDKVVVSDTTTSDFTSAQYALTPPYSVVFTSPTTYDVVNSSTNAVVVGGVAFTPNQPNNMLQQAGLYPASGYDVVFNGVPATGDRVDIQYNNGGIGDNRNAQLLNGLATTNTIANGTATYQSSYGQLVSGVGTRTKDAQIGQEAAQSILNQTQAQRDSISGVNLDEEAANLMKFQQAYQASARVVKVSSDLFDAILNAL